MLQRRASYRKVPLRRVSPPFSLALSSNRITQSLSRHSGPRTFEQLLSRASSGWREGLNFSFFKNPFEKKIISVEINDYMESFAGCYCTLIKKMSK